MARAAASVTKNGSFRGIILASVDDHVEAGRISREDEIREKRNAALVKARIALAAKRAAAKTARTGGVDGTGVPREAARRTSSVTEHSGAEAIAQPVVHPSELDATSRLWTAYLGVDVTPDDVEAMMVMARAAQLRAQRS